MATLREYFSSDFRTMMHESEWTFGSERSGGFTVFGRVHFDPDSYTRYLSFFWAEADYTFEHACAVIKEPAIFVEDAQKVGVEIGHVATFPQTVSVNDFRFSRRIFFYIDAHVSDAEKSATLAFAQQHDYFLEIRDQAYSDYRALHEKSWAFISHDSRDKEELVRPLADKLRSMMCPVWYDEYSLKVGDSLRESIDNGIAEARKCVLVLSPNFLANPGWTKGEFNAAVGKHFSAGGAVLLPIWHGVSRDQVAEYSPMIADIHALRSDIGIDELAGKLFPAIRPAQ